MARSATRRRAGRPRPAETARAGPRAGDAANVLEDAATGLRRLKGAPVPDGNGMMALQATGGNAAVTRLVQARRGRTAPGIQAKLLVGAANDPLEREADRMADYVMHRCSSAEGAGRRHEADDDSVRRLADPGYDLASAFEADPAVSRRLSVRQGRGETLSPPVRQRMEAGFGTDFSAVRIHRDPEAAELSTGLAARAFTLGSDIYFGSGAYAPGSRSGQHLLAHELSHVVQQGGVGGRRLERKPVDFRQIEKFLEKSRDARRNQLET